MLSLKRIFAGLCLLATMPFAAEWTGASSIPEVTRTIDGKKFYVVSTADELAWIATQVNAGSTTINVILKNDIVFGKDTASTASYAWTPIGKDSTVMFNGIFDGDGHTIYGTLIVNQKFSAVLGILGSSGIIRNLTIGKSVVSKSRRTGHNSEISFYHGGIVSINSGIIENCINRSSNANYDTLSVSNVSVGIMTTAGQLNVFTGGIAGYNYGNISNCINESIITDSVYIKHFYNSGIITEHIRAAGYLYMHQGGLAGMNEGLIEFCINKASIRPYVMYKYTAYSSPYAKTTLYNYLISGGIAGSNKGTIINCINTGSLFPYYGASTSGDGGSYSYAYAQNGGIIGINTSGSVKNSINYANLIGSEKSQYYANLTSYNTGVCMTNQSSLVNAYFDLSLLPEISAISVGSGTNVTGKTTSDMQKDQFAWILNTANGAENNGGAWSRYDGYPVFANDTLLAIRKIIFDDGENTITRYTNYKGLVTEFPETPTAPVGKAFAGWINSSSDTCKSNTIFTEDQTITALFLDWADVVYSVRFLNENGEILDLESVRSGETPEYTGTTPTKTASAAYSYSFAGWTPTLSAVTWHTDFYASFDSTLNQYNVTYKDYDGAILYSADFDYGTKPTYATIPKRSNTIGYIYTFARWSPTVENVSGIAVYVAQYDSTKLNYEIVFKNGNTVLSSQTLFYGDLPSYSGDSPTKSATTQHTYSFSGWSPIISAVSGNTTYTALFDSTLNQYTVIFVSGAQTLQSSNVDYGTAPNYLGSTPTKSATTQYTYTFSAWSPTFSPVVDNATYSAVFDSTIRSYEITFVNKNTTLQSSEIAYGTLPPYSGVLPSKEESAGYTYSFAGWTPSITSVKTDAIYTAIFDSTAKQFKITFMNDQDTLQTILLNYGVHPTYTGNMPTKESTILYDYSFIGWSPTITTVAANVSYHAVFDSTLSESSSIKDVENLHKLHYTVNTIGDHQIQITNAPIGATFTILDLQGRFISKGIVNRHSFVLTINSQGRYIVRINGVSKTVSIR